MAARDDHHRWIRAAVRAAGRGAGRTVVVQGAPGTGRSRLLLDAVDLAEVEGAAAARVRACGRPLGAVRRLAEALGRTAPADDDPVALAEALASGGAGAGAGGDGRGGVARGPQPRAGVAVRRGGGASAGAGAGAGSTLLALDDADRCDPATLRALAHLVEATATRPVVLVLSHGPAGVAEPLRTALADPARIHLVLAPLTAAETGAMLADALGALQDPAVVEAVHADTAGLPRLVEAHAVAALARHGAGARLTPADVAACAPPHVLRPASDPVAARALPAIAALAEHATARRVAAVAGLPHADTAALLARLHRAGALAGADPPRLPAPLLARALLASLDPGARRRLQLAAARTLDADGDGRPAEEHVRALLLTAPPGRDRWAAERLHALGRAAHRAGRPRDAEAALRRACDELPDARPQRAALLADLARTAATLRAPDAAGLLARAHAQTSDPGAKAALALELGREQRLRGDRDRALATWTEARTLADAAAATADASALTHRLDAERAARDLLGPDAPGLERTALGRAVLADRAARHHLDLPASVALAVDALEDPALAAEERSTIVPRALAVLVWADELELAATLGERLAHRAVARGDHWTAATVRLVTAHAHHRAGALEHAATAAERAHDELGPDDPARAHATAALVTIAVARGALDDAEHALGTLPPATARAPRALLHARAALHLARDRPHAALSDARAAAAAAETVHDRNPAAAPWRLDAARAQLALHDREVAGALAHAQLRLAEAWGAPSATAAALRTLAAVHAADPDGRTSGHTARTGPLRAAAALLERSPAAAERAATLVALGVADLHAGHELAAQERLLDGLELAEACGLHPLAATARTALVQAGGRPRRPATGPQALTPSERQVAALAAHGRTNAQIAAELVLSPHTVASHLKRAYRKLGIRARGQLADALGGTSPATSPAAPASRPAPRAP